MSFECDWCNKKFTKKQSLEYHKYLSKVPCNLKCRKCGIVFDRKQEYKEHQQQHDSKKIENEEQKLQNVMMPIPIQDFNLAALKELHALNDDDIIILAQEEQYFEKVQTPREYFEKVQTPKEYFEEDTSIKNDIELVTVTHTKKITYLRRTRDAKNAIPPSVLSRALMTGIAPAPGTHSYGLGKCAQSTLEAALTQNDTRFHNVCLGDMSRGTVRVLTRNELDQCYWSIYKKDAAKVVVEQHAKNLFWFVLESCLSLLCPVIWMTHPNHKVCLALQGEDDAKMLLVYDSNTSFCASKLNSVQVAKNELNFDIDKDDGRVNNLVVKVKQQQAVMSNKSDPRAVMNFDDVYKVLEHGRRFCYDTMKQSIKEISDLSSN